MSDKTQKKTIARMRKKKRVRQKIVGTSEKPRLAVFRSARHIYAQIIDDSTNKTLAVSSTLTKDLAAELKKAKTK